MRHTILKRRLYCAGLLLMLFGIVGCGTGNMSGVVKYKGQPVVTGTVTVVGRDKFPRQGVIGEDGSYKVTGIPAGPVQISVNSPDPNEKTATPPLTTLPPGSKDKLGGGKPQGGEPPSGSKPGAVKNWKPIPGKFADFEKSGLTFDVVTGENPYDIELK
jgi:hypothetical protein